MHQDINPPLKNTTSLVLAKPTLNLQTFQAPLFRQCPLFIGFFVKYPPICWFFILYSILSFKNKIFQFEFNFVYKLFLLLNISDFGSIFFVKLATLPPLKKVIYFFPSNSLSKLRSCQALPF